MKHLFRFELSEDSCMRFVVFHAKDHSEAVDLFIAFFGEHMLQSFVISVIKDC